MENTHPSDEIVRVRAYKLWQDAGCPTGSPDEFWHRARAELSVENTADDTAIEDSFPASDPSPHSGITGVKAPV